MTGNVLRQACAAPSCSGAGRRQRVVVRARNGHAKAGPGVPIAEPQRTVYFVGTSLTTVFADTVTWFP